MKEETVYSPVLDENMQRDMNGSRIWFNCFHEEEVAVKQRQYPRIYKYRIKFNGLTPVQLLELTKVD